MGDFYKATVCGHTKKGMNPDGVSKHKFIYVPSAGATAAVGLKSDGGGCFVAIEGTSTVQQAVLEGNTALTNFHPDTCPGCQVSTGYLTNYNAVNKQIFAGLSELGCKGKELSLVGHSLGAACLSMLLYEVLDAGYKVAYAYALESPRPGNLAFAETLHKKAQGVNAWRVTHYLDICVHVPPTWMGYSHAFYEIFYPHAVGLKYQVCEEFDGLNCARKLEIGLSVLPHCWYLDKNPCFCGQEDVAANSTQLSDGSIFV